MGILCRSFKENLKSFLHQWFEAYKIPPLLEKILAELYPEITPTFTKYMEISYFAPSGKKWKYLDAEKILKNTKPLVFL